MTKNEISPSFQWVTSSIVNSEPETKGCIEYEQLKITNGGKTEILKIHDSVLLRSDDNPKNDKGKGNAVETFVARIEKMWEEPLEVSSSTGSANATKERKEDEKGKTEEYTSERTSRMKIRARWYFKKKDMQNMRGTFLFPGINRRNFINSLTPQVLILGEQSDDNEVATILSKCQVLQCRPENTATVLEANKDKPNVFVCSHTVYMPKQEEEGYGTVLIHPIDGDDHDTMKDIATPVIFHEEEEVISTNKVKTSESDNKRKRSVQDVNVTNVNSTENNEKDESNEVELSQSKRAKTNVNTESTITTDATMSDKNEENEHQNENTNQDQKDLIQKDDPDAKEKEANNTPKNISSPSQGKSTEENEGTKNIDTIEASKEMITDEVKKEASNNKSKNSNKSESSSSEDDETSASSQQKGKSTNSNRNPPSSPKITVKEGAIHVGPNHQATIPPMPTGSLTSRMAKRKNSLKNKDQANQPVATWSPNSISDDTYDQYISEAAIVLKKFMNENNIESDGVNASSILMGALGDGREIELLKAEKSTTPSKLVKQTERKTRLLTRECNEDKLISTLHDVSYDIPSAIKKIKDDPIAYLTVWSSNEKESFNNGFRRYRGSLRSISKGVSSKTYKDIVDYHYRFKIPTQFRKYQEKKREQAKRMMGLMDNKMEYSSGRKSRSWSKVGAHEQRKSAAKDFLIQVRDTIGPENYLLLAAHLKMYQSKNQSISVLKENVTPLLHSNTSLLEKFLDFLPKKYRA